MYYEIYHILDVIASVYFLPGFLEPFLIFFAVSSPYLVLYTRFHTRMSSKSYAILRSWFNICITIFTSCLPLQDVYPYLKIAWFFWSFWCIVSLFRVLHETQPAVYRIITSYYVCLIFYPSTSTS